MRIELVRIFFDQLNIFRRFETALTRRIHSQGHLKIIYQYFHVYRPIVLTNRTENIEFVYGHNRVKFQNFSLRNVSCRFKIFRK